MYSGLFFLHHFDYVRRLAHLGEAAEHYGKKQDSFS